ncbi:MAG TPA: Holliday junction resolvase RuvX [Oceanithermus sp.]|nr:Holliday junction resolvase RuvX [Oceanithermus sp.]
MKVAALDVGEARIGRAVGELGRPFAFGRGYLLRKGFDEDVEALARWLEAEGARRVVVGLPLRTGGEEGPEAEAVRTLGEALAKKGFEVVYEDERFTTRLAAERLKAAPRRLRREKGKLDELAAVLLLEGYLARHG